MAVTASGQPPPGRRPGLCGSSSMGRALGFVLVGLRLLAKPAGPYWVLQHPWVPGGSDHFAGGTLEGQLGSGVGYLHGSSHGLCRGGFSSEQRFVV